MGECYVCTDMCYTLSPCNCTNAYLHEECYSRLIAYNNKKCTICLADFPIQTIPPKESSAELSEERSELFEEDDILYPPIWYIIMPILMRPYYYSPLNSTDAYFDFPRNMLWVTGYMSLFHVIDNPDIEWSAIFSTPSIIQWFMCIIIHISFCILVRHTLTKKTTPGLLL